MIIAVPLKEATNAKIYISSIDEEMLHDNVKSMAHHFGYQYKPCYADAVLSDGGVIDLDFASLKVISTPGHTKGSLSFICEQDNCVFTGDTLFYDSVGRSDFPGGDYDELLSSIKNKLFTLPYDMKVLPGHGPETTIIREKEENPFLGFGWNK